ncbi:MAG: hypothetical protein ACK5DW_03170, partial [Burkholderiales bacterium]
FGEPAMQIESLSTELVEKAFQFIANPHGQFPPAELQHLQPGHWQALGHLLATIYAEKQVRLLN